ncbi:MAG: hypothetical protein GC204_02595 [Chloroflexi bacterium]|nr:hypothetical protein [Chloroflexota bacterium]
MTDRKTALLKELDDARAYLNETLARLDDDTEIYPGWKKREFVAHIGGWEAMCYEAFRDYRAGAPRRSYPYDNADAANAYLIAVRQNMPLVDMMVEYEINRLIVKQFLKEIPVEDYNQPVSFVWYQDTVEQFIHDTVKHERDHAADIRALKP